MRKFQLKFLVAEKISPYKQLLAGPKLIHHHKLLKRPTKELTSEQRLGNTLTTLVHHSVLYTGHRNGGFRSIIPSFDVDHDVVFYYRRAKNGFRSYTIK